MSQPPSVLSLASRLAERTLANRMARADELAPSGKTLTVGPGAYPTITAAVADATDGDTVLVEPGTYRESVKIQRSITVTGNGARDAVVIESDRMHFALDHTSGRLANLTIRGGNKHELAAVLITGGSPTVERIAFTRSHGIVAEMGASPTIRGCSFDGASRTIEADESFDDADMSSHERPRWRKVIRNNAVHGRTGILVSDGAAGIIEANDIFGHWGCGIVIADDGTAPLIRDNTIRDNPGSGIQVCDGAGGTVESNNIFGNGSAILDADFMIFEDIPYDPSGILISNEGTAPIIRNNKIRDNLGIGIQVCDGAGGTIEANSISGNSFSRIQVTGDRTAPIIRNNTISGGGDSAILVYGGAGGTIEGNDVLAENCIGINTGGEGTAPIIRSNTIHGRPRAGFALVDIAEGAAGTVSGNTIGADKASAIRVHRLASPHVSHNITD